MKHLLESFGPVKLYQDIDDVADLWIEYASTDGGLIFMSFRSLESARATYGALVALVVIGGQVSSGPGKTGG